MNTARKLAKKNIKQRQLDNASKTFIQMFNNGKSAKEIGAVLGISEQQASRLILKAKLKLNKGDDCSASVTVTYADVEKKEERPCK